MTVPPLASLLICAGLLMLSMVIVQRAKKGALFAKATSRVLLWTGLAILALGLVLQLLGPPHDAARRAAASPSGASSAPGAQAQTAATAPALASWSFSFEPESARWGDEVRIRLVPAVENVTIYFNGTPLPHRALEKGVFAVTVPTISKSGYFVVEHGGAKVKADKELMVRR